jgi:hypothetical protein
MIHVFGGRGILGLRIADPRGRLVAAWVSGGRPAASLSLPVEGARGGPYLLDVRGPSGRTETFLAVP